LKHILLIGGEGYIGNVVCRRLLNEGYAVTSYDALLYQNNLCVLNKIEDKNFNFIHGDIVDSKRLTAVLSNVDGVVLLAGLVGDPITKKYPNESEFINDHGVLNVIELCAQKNIERFIFISTCSNYGLIEGDDLADENFALKPLSLYAKSKVNAERYIMSLKGKTAMNPTVLRFATAFGLSPRMRFDLTVSEFTLELARGNELLVYDAKTWRPYCHVQDFARLIQAVLEADISDVTFEIFNAGGEINNATKQMIVDSILAEIPEGRVHYQEHGSDPRNYKVNFNKVKTRLGFQPQYSITDGVKELTLAVKNHVFERVDQMKKFHGNYEIEYPVEI